MQEFKMQEIRMQEMEDGKWRIEGERRVSVVSTSSTTELDPELVEGNSGDFSLVLSFGSSKRKYKFE